MPKKTKKQKIPITIILAATNKPSAVVVSQVNNKTARKRQTPDLENSNLRKYRIHKNKDNLKFVISICFYFCEMNKPGERAHEQQPQQPTAC